MAFRLHHNINGEVFIFSLGVNAISLDAERVEEQLIRPPLIVEGIEQHADVIIVENVITFRHGGAHTVRFVVRKKSYIEHPGIVTHENFGGPRRRDVIAGVRLVEVLEHCGRFPNLVIEPAINLRRRFETWNRYRVQLLRRQQRRLSRLRLRNSPKDKADYEKN
nr:hypothetical protein [uncultured bacterium]